MQVSDYLGQYTNTLAGAGTSQPAAGTAGSPMPQNLTSSLTELPEGTVFEGSIHSMDGNKVTLSLGNGQTVTARLDGNMGLSLGQSVFFQVKSNDGKTIAIKPFSDAQFNPTIQKALAAAGLEMTNDTIALVNRMMGEGMPIDKNSLASMHQAVMRNPMVPMQTAVTMAKLGIPVNDRMAAQFENYQNDRHAMLGQMERVMDGLPSVFSKVSGGAEGLMQLNAQILTILNGAEEMPQGASALLFADVANAEALLRESGTQPQAGGAAGQAGNAAAQAGGAGQAVAEAMQQILTQAAEGSAQTGQAGQTAQAGGAAGQAGNAAAQAGGAGQAVAEAMQQILAQVAGDGTGQTQQAVAEAVRQTLAQAAGSADAQAAGSQVPDGGTQAAESERQADGQLPQVTNAAAQAGQEPHRLADLLSRQRMMELETQVKEVFPKMENQNLNTQLTAKEFLSSLSKLLNEQQPSNQAALSKLFSGKAYHALLKDVMQQQWTVRPEDLKTEHKVEELYKRLDRQMHQIEQLAKQTGMQTGQLSQSAAQVRDNIAFMHQLNQAYTYVQIPLKMANQNAHSDLYVYTNKRNLKNREGELSAFLHLELENLGCTDVSIKMRNKNVSTKFYLSDDDAYALVEKHLPMLQERLKKLGYNCSVSVENRQEKVDFVEDFLRKSQPAKAAARGMVQRYSFDVRA